MNKEEIKKIAASLLFDVNDDVLKDFEQFFTKHLEEELRALQAIDTIGIEPMSFVDPSPKAYMRDDEPGESLAKDKLLGNAANKNHDFVVLSKVVNNED